MDERRQLPRWEIKKDAKAWLPDTQGFSIWKIEDMHLKGMRVSLDQRLPELGPLKISFAIGDSFEFINIEVKIPWKNEIQGRFIYGLEFSKINDVDKDKIYQYINTHCFEQFKNRWWGE